MKKIIYKTQKIVENVIKNSFLFYYLYTMQKRALIWLSIIWFLCLSVAIFFWYKYQEEVKLTNSFVKIHTLLLESYANGVNYVLCNEDWNLWNVKWAVCESYLDSYAEDVEFLKKEFWLKPTYKYVWK